MMTNDGELLAAQARVQVIQAMLAHARKTCTPESFQDQAKGWLAEWQRLEFAEHIVRMAKAHAALKLRRS